jgi:hypothetical protein
MGIRFNEARFQKIQGGLMFVHFDYVGIKFYELAEQLKNCRDPGSRKKDTRADADGPG